MKLVRVARNVILAGLAWRYIARRRALARERRTRRIIAPVLIAGGAGVIWAARPRIVAGARRLLDVASRNLDRKSGAGEHGEPPQGVRTPERAEGEHPMREGGQTEPRPSGSTSAAGTTGYGEPKPSAKKQRKRARRQRAQEREKTERESAHGGSVKVEVNEEPELRASLGELKH